METITQLLDNKSFLKTLFDAIPCAILILDRDRRIHAANNFFLKAYGGPESEALMKRVGNVIQCVNALKTDEGCGFSEECSSCAIRNTALKAVAGDRIERKRANMEFFLEGRSQDLSLLISAAPFEHDGDRLAIVMFEDVTELNHLRKRLKTEQSFRGIIGQDPRMEELFETIRDVADVDVPVLIQGESGTGKELVAAAIHNEGPRAERLFVPVNCAALPEGLLESELFGHVKGAFTGAIRDKKGRFELADGGTLFLDEIGDLPKTVQVKLLRVLQEGIFERVGGEKSLSVNVRIISATNRDLAREVAKGHFRKDLYYRIRVVPITIPALRERRDDIPLLVNHFLQKESHAGSPVRGISPEALALMVEYSWPGNVRELQSALRFALLKARGGVIRLEHLPAELKEWQESRPSRGPRRKLDRKAVLDALVRAGGNKAKAARMLGVGRATLYRFLSEQPDIRSE
ncbi:MAG: sigma-54-dependent Fis family transcriptional regulator [Deltaproteobacteria bacterium]|nr:MAG: sigma-54-dependent Fis family transcriptional regulator [Deltaproteobacteria bacterium]